MLNNSMKYKLVYCPECSISGENRYPATMECENAAVPVCGIHKSTGNECEREHKNEKRA